MVVPEGVLIKIARVLALIVWKTSVIRLSRLRLAAVLALLLTAALCAIALVGVAASPAQASQTRRLTVKQVKTAIHHFADEASEGLVADPPTLNGCMIHKLKAGEVGTCGVWYSFTGAGEQTLYCYAAMPSHPITVVRVQLQECEAQR